MVCYFNAKTQSRKENHVSNRIVVGAKGFLPKGSRVIGGAKGFRPHLKPEGQKLAAVA